MPKDLQLPYHHQKNCYFCGPTCLKMVLEKFKVKKTEDIMAQLAGTSKEKGTSHQGMINAAKALGFSSFIHENANLKTVTSFLSAKLPVIVDWTDNKSDTGHYSVMTDVEKEYVFLADPWYGPAYPVARKTFEKYWNDGLTRGNRWIMVVLPKEVKASTEIKIRANKAKILIASGRIYHP